MDSMPFSPITLKIGDEEFKSSYMHHNPKSIHYDTAFQGVLGTTCCCGSACLYVPGGFSGYYKHFEDLILTTKKSVILLVLPYVRSVYKDDISRSSTPIFPWFFEHFNEQHKGVAKMHYEQVINVDSNYQFLIVIEQLNKDKYYNLFNIKEEEE